MLAAVAHTLDRVRSPVLGAVLGRFAILRDVAANRRARLAVGAALALATALAVSLAAPATWFVWAPLALGVPHVLADLRYLLLGPYRRVALRRRDTVLAAGLLATAVVSAPILGAAVVLGAVVLTPITAPRRHAVALGLAGALAYTAYAAPLVTGYALLHGHNLVALLGFALVTRQRGVAGYLALATVALAALVLAGALDPLLPRAQLDDLAGYVLPDAALDRWPPVLCARIALSFVFLQGMHYAIWLRLLPAAARGHAGLRGFGASLRALERDLTPAGVAVAAALILALPVLAVVGADDPAALRATYVQLAGGHAYLELAILGRWLACRS